jgi:hypothetical protein
VFSILGPTVRRGTRKTSLTTRWTMLSASLVMDVEDDEALGETAPTVEELERFQPNAVVAARQFRSAGHAMGLD